MNFREFIIKKGRFQLAGTDLFIFKYVLSLYNKLICFRSEILFYKNVVYSVC
jgi:hypothetical protein